MREGGEEICCVVQVYFAKMLVILTSFEILFV